MSSKYLEVLISLTPVTIVTRFIVTGNKGKELMNKQKTIVGKKKVERMDPGNLEKNLILGEELT